MKFNTIQCDSMQFQSHFHCVFWTIDMVKSVRSQIGLVDEIEHNKTVLASSIVQNTQMHWKSLWNCIELHYKFTRASQFTYPRLLVKNTWCYKNDESKLRLGGGEGWKPLYFWFFIKVSNPNIVISKSAPRLWDFHSKRACFSINF